MSGDVDQGREMQVLPRQLDALDPAVLAVDRLSQDRRPGHPQRVPGIVKPLSVEGSKAREAVGAGGLEVAGVRRRGARIGEPLRGDN